MEAGNRPGPSDDRMTQSCMEPSTTSGDYNAGAGVLRAREPVCSSSPLLAVSPSLSSICSETGEARGEAAAHAGIAPFPMLPNDASAYPELQPTPRAHHSNAHNSSRGVRDVSSSSSSSSPSSAASQEHHHRPPRRLIYRDPDFDLDSSSSSPAVSHAPASPPPHSDPSPPPDPDAAVRRERIRRRESPETYRRLSQAWDAAAQYKQYGFIDPPNGNTPPHQLMDLPVEKIRSLSKERKRSKSKDRQRGSGERGEKAARGDGGATCPHGRRRHQRSRSGDSSVDRTRRHRHRHRSSRHSASFDTPPAGSTEGVMALSATAGVSQATQVETTYLTAQLKQNTAAAAEEENSFTTPSRARDNSIGADTANNTLTSSQGRDSRAGGDNISRNNSRGKADGCHQGGRKGNPNNETSETEVYVRHRTDNYHNPLSSSSS